MFLITHIPIPKIDAPPQTDKLVHFVGYAGLMFLFRSRQLLHHKTGWAGATWFAAILLVLYAIADELLQGPVNRSPDVWDAVADSVGILIGAVLFFFCWPILEKVITRQSQASTESSE